MLASAKDKEWLSPHLCVLRNSIEAFAANAEDIEARRRQGGTTRNPPQVGYVGIRCVHCKHLPLKKRVKAAEAYPSSVSWVQGRNMCIKYVFCCNYHVDIACEYHRGCGFACG